MGFFSGVQLGRPSCCIWTLHRGGIGYSRYGETILPGTLVASGPWYGKYEIWSLRLWCQIVIYVLIVWFVNYRGLSKWRLWSQDSRGDGRDRFIRSINSRLRMRRNEHCCIGSHYKGSRARGFRLPIWNVCAEFAHHDGYLRVWHRRAEGKVPTSARKGKIVGMFWSDRAESWIRSRVNGNSCTRTSDEERIL